MVLRRSGLAALAGFCLMFTAETPPASAQDGFLSTLHRQTILTPTVPDNGDQNPYAIVVAPVSAGTIRQGDVLLTNFNNAGNLQGTGSTIVNYRPETKKLSLFAQIPQGLANCPGGIGLGTALIMLRSGWVIVGSAPSTDGTAATKGTGCLIVLNAAGQVAEVWSGPDIDAPWGNMAVIDRGATATLFVSNIGPGIGAQNPAGRTDKASVLRLELAMPDGKTPSITGRTVIASGFGARGDADVFLIGPTGLALGAEGTLYISDAAENRITAIADAATRTDSAGTGREITRDGKLHRPLAMTMAPNGHLLVTNGLNGQAVEIDPLNGKQIGARWIDKNKAQQPPGSGDLFGIAMTPAGDGFYFVMDEVNMLALAR